MEEAKINGTRNRSPTCAPDNGMANQSSSPTRSSAPEQPPPPPPHRLPRWLILDRTVHWSRRKRCGVIENDATASTLSHDCVGRPVRVSLRIASPPAISRLYVHLTGRPPIESLSDPRTVAAHGNSILFHMAAPFEDPLLWSRAPFFPHDYFVYSCSSSPARLTLLPPCFHGGAAPDPKVDYLFQPYRNQQQRMMTSQDVGILCHGDHGEFRVAQLTFAKNDEFELCVLHHPPPHAAPVNQMEWTVVKKLKNPTAEYTDSDSYRKINIDSWVTDGVVPVGRRCMGWVDYYQGMILADVLLPTDNTDSSSSCDHPDDHHRRQLLRYIPLPKKALKYRRPYRDADSPDPLRTVGVTDDGTIKLVCILTERPAPSCPFTIATWTLDDDRHGGGGRWVMDRSNGVGSHTMGQEEFFSLFGADAGHGLLPRVQPSFPLVSLGDPDVVCFLLRDDKDRGLFWMIEVDMENKKLLSSAIYISEEEEGYPLKIKRGCRNINFYGDYFIPTKFSSYLTEDAITSWELSEKMQEAKKERVMEKIGLEAELKK